MTYYTVFIIDLASRRVQILGSTPHPETLFMQQIVRTLTMAEASLSQVLICDGDRKWSHDVRRRLRDAGIRVVLIPECARNANAYAERFVRSIKEECLECEVLGFVDVVLRHQDLLDQEGSTGRAVLAKESDHFTERRSASTLAVSTSSNT